MKRSHLALAIIVLVLIIDQALKFWIKTSMFYGEEIDVIGDWFKLNFVENEGMAFGMTFGGKTGKVLLTIFRIVAVGFIGFFLYRLISKKSSRGLIASMALILAGALGNIIDSVFYGLLFSDSSWHLKNVAEFLPDEGGYGALLHGKVVDMFYFPLFSGTWPNWIPMVGGDEFLFFRPVFNIADAAITVGVIIILVFQKRFFGETGKEEEPEVQVSEQAVSNEEPFSPPGKSDQY